MQLLLIVGIIDLYILQGVLYFAEFTVILDHVVVIIIILICFESLCVSVHQAEVLGGV